MEQVTENIFVWHEGRQIFTKDEEEEIQKMVRQAEAENRRQMELRKKGIDPLAELVAYLETPGNNQ